MLRTLLRFFFGRIWPLIPGHKRIITLFASKFIAGKSIEEAIAVAKKLNNEGFSCLFNYIGEHSEKDADILRTLETYSKLVDEMKLQKIRGGITPKLSSVGLLGNHPLKAAWETKFFLLLEKARNANFPIWFDQEEIKYRQETDQILMATNYRFPVGAVFQSYDKNIMESVNLLTRNRHISMFGICKGAYSESKKMVYTNAGEIKICFEGLAAYLSNCSSLLQFRTHDKSIIDFVKKIEQRATGFHKDRFEFAMLLGVDMELARSLLKEGYEVVIYIPFGEDIEGYCIRRIIEKPAYIFLSILSLFRSRN